MKLVKNFLFISMVVLCGNSLMGQCADINNKNQDPSEGIAVGFEKRLDNVITTNSSNENVYGEIFMSPKDGKCALSSVTINIERHPSQPSGGKLYIDLYKMDAYSKPGGEQSSYPLLKYLSTSDAVSNPSGEVTARFSKPAILAASAKYVFLVRPEGFNTYYLVGGKDYYLPGTAIGARSNADQNNGNITTPPADIYLDGPSDYPYNDIYFACTFSSPGTSSQDFNPNTYYRLTTQWQGDDKSLDVINDGKNNQLQLAKSGKYSGQAWKITPLGNGYYRLTTQWQGDGKSLDVVNDGKNNKLQLAKSGRYSGQAWKITDISGDLETQTKVLEMDCKGSKNGAKATFLSKQGQTIKLKMDWNEGATFVAKTNLNITNGTCEDCPTLGGLGGERPRQATYTIRQTDASKPVTIKWGGNAGNIRFCGEDRSLVIPN